MVFVLSSSQFKRSVRDNLYNMDIPGIFMIPEYHVDKLFERWCIEVAQEDYKVYLQMIYSLPEDIQFVDTDLWIFKRTRRILDEFIVAMAESYYYDDLFFSPEHCYPEPFMNKKIERLDRCAIEYFLDHIDFSYGRLGFNEPPTVERLRAAARDSNYLR